MARKERFLSLLAVMIISLGLGVFAFRGFAKEQNSGRSYDKGIASEKIEEVLKNQQDIIARLEDIRNELDIIRVRASRR